MSGVLYQAFKVRREHRAPVTPHSTSRRLSVRSALPYGVGVGGGAGGSSGGGVAPSRM